MSHHLGHVVNVFHFTATDCQSPLWALGTPSLQSLYAPQCNGLLMSPSMRSATPLRIELFLPHFIIDFFSHRKPKEFSVSLYILWMRQSRSIRLCSEWWRETSMQFFKAQARISWRKSLRNFHLWINYIRALAFCSLNLEMKYFS